MEKPSCYSTRNWCAMLIGMVLDLPFLHTQDDNFTLQRSEKKSELEYNIETARSDDYNQTSIQAIFDKKEGKLHKTLLTTLTTLAETLAKLGVDFVFSNKQLEYSTRAQRRTTPKL
uniref:(northern house mosquito) hypothetical protein n=1 Tax=Culex pipiens TaxID=7175 RepID=A0A8D8GA53_CULPI